jgi:two-component system, NarL family, invasion response regulator UvrY
MKILIVDDHFVVREGLSRLLSRVPDIHIREAASTQDALVAFREDRPDLVLLDLNLPNSSGLELLKRLMLKDKSTRVLVFSMHTEPNYVVDALKAGARGYVSKSAPVEELITAIRHVADGRPYIEREIASNLTRSVR